MPLPSRVTRAARGPAKTINRLVSTPGGAAGRYRPLYPLNLVDRVRNGPRTLERAVGGRVVVVTGASSGIGAATAARLGAAGARVVLVARSVDALEEVAGRVREGGGHAETRPCDLTDGERVDALIGDVLAAHGGVDVLVNNAGKSIRRSLELSYARIDDFERTMALNYFAAVRLILGVLPQMRAAGRGQVVNISSAGVLARVPRFGAYIASKAALDTLCDALQAEVRDDGVRFTTVHMPLVRTPMIAPTALYARVPALSAVEAAEVVAEAITYRARRVTPPFGHVAAAADALSPYLSDLVRSQGFKLLDDAQPPRAPGPPPE